MLLKSTPFGWRCLPNWDLNRSQMMLDASVIRRKSIRSSSPRVAPERIETWSQSQGMSGKLGFDPAVATDRRRTHGRGFRVPEYRCVGGLIAVRCRFEVRLSEPLSSGGAGSARRGTHVLGPCRLAAAGTVQRELGQVVDESLAIESWRRHEPVVQDRQAEHHGNDGSKLYR